MYQAFVGGRGIEPAGRLSGSAICVCSAAVEREGNVIPVAFSIQTKHTPTYTHTTCICLQAYLLTSEWCLCACVYAQCHCLRGWATVYWAGDGWRRNCSAGGWMSEMIVFFLSSLCLIFPLFLFRRPSNTHTQTFWMWGLEWGESKNKSQLKYLTLLIQMMARFKLICVTAFLSLFIISDISLMYKCPCETCMRCDHTLHN